MKKQQLMGYKSQFCSYISTWLISTLPFLNQQLSPCQTKVGFVWRVHWMHPAFFLVSIGVPAKYSLIQIRYTIKLKNPKKFIVPECQYWQHLIYVCVNTNVTFMHCIIFQNVNVDSLKNPLYEPNTIQIKSNHHENIY